MGAEKVYVDMYDLVRELAPALTASWQDDAACKGANANLWFPKLGASKSIARAAKSVCEGCPVKVECATFARETFAEVGIWGGMAKQELVAWERERVA